MKDRLELVGYVPRRPAHHRRSLWRWGGVSAVTALVALGAILPAGAQNRRRSLAQSSGLSSSPARAPSTAPAGAAAAAAAATAPSPHAVPMSAPPLTRPMPISRLQNFRDEYSVIAEQSIFLRDRAPRLRSTGPSTQPSTRSPEQSYVLNGVVLEGGERRAYFEDRIHGGVIKLSIGDSLAHGTIAGIDIDSVAYRPANGRETWINVGSDLTGSTAAPPLASTTASATTAPALDFDPNSPNLTLEQKMKLRRAQQLNAK